RFLLDDSCWPVNLLHSKLFPGRDCLLLFFSCFEATNVITCTNHFLLRFRRADGRSKLSFLCRRSSRNCLCFRFRSHCRLLLENNLNTNHSKLIRNNIRIGFCESVLPCVHEIVSTSEIFGRPSSCFDKFALTQNAFSAATERTRH